MTCPDYAGFYLFFLPLSELKNKMKQTVTSAAIPFEWGLQHWRNTKQADATNEQTATNARFLTKIWARVVTILYNTLCISACINCRINLGTRQSQWQQKRHLNNNNSYPSSFMQNRLSTARNKHPSLNSSAGAVWPNQLSLSTNG